MESLARPATRRCESVRARGARTGSDAAWNDAWKASIDQWSALLQQGSRSRFAENLRKIVDPAEWAKPAPGSFDFGIER